MLGTTALSNTLDDNQNISNLELCLNYVFYFILTYHYFNRDGLYIFYLTTTTLLILLIIIIIRFKLKNHISRK